MVDADPMMAMRRPIKIVGSVVMYDVARRAIRGRQVRTAVPCVFAITMGVVIVAGMESLMTDVRSAVMAVIAAIIPTAVVPIVTIDTILRREVIAMVAIPVAVVAAPSALLMTAAIVIAVMRLGQHRAGHQRYGQGSGKNAFHLSSSESILPTVAPLSTSSADWCLNDAGQAAFRFDAFEEKE